MYNNYIASPSDSTYNDPSDWLNGGSGETDTQYIDDYTQYHGILTV